MGNYFRKYFNILNNINDAIYIHKIDITKNLLDKFIFVNDAAIRKTGYSYEEFLKMTPHDLDSPKITDENLKIFENLKEYAEIIFETTHVTKDNKKINVEISSKIINIPECEGNFIMSVARDISDRKLLENELKKFKKLADKSNSGFCFLDLNEEIIYINPYLAELHNYKQEELIGKKWRSLHFKENYNKIDELKKTLFEKGYIDSIKMHHKTKNGNSITILSNIVYIVTDIGNFIGVTSVDLTEEEKILQNLIKTKNKALEANKIKEIFLANINHELRTPLTGVLGALSILKGRNLDEESKSFIDMMEDSSYRLKELVDELLMASKIKYGHIKKNFNWVNLEKIFMKIKVKYESYADMKKMKFESNSNNISNKKIKTDIIMVEEIIRNLLSNAFKFTEKGKIFFEMSLKKNILKIIVKDTGIGIKKEYMDSLFKEFSQQDLSYTKKYEGFGLGLFIIKKYVDLLNGKIDFDSVVDKGTEFIIHIPVEINQKSIQEVNLSNKKVLIFENNLDNLEEMRKYLEEEKIDFNIANNNEEILKKYLENKFDLIIINMQIEKNDGFDFIKKIRKIDNDTPILGISELTRPEDRFKFILAGVNDFIAKPYSKKEFLKTLKNII